jgi:hypothetical protein
MQAACDSFTNAIQGGRGSGYVARGEDGEKVFVVLLRTVITIALTASFPVRRSTIFCLKAMEYGLVML